MEAAAATASAQWQKSLFSVTPAKLRKVSLKPHYVWWK